MTPEPLTYHLTEITSPADPRRLLKADGDVRAAAWADSEHLLRTLAELEPGSATVALRFLYQPSANGSDRQGRLSVHLVARAHRQDTQGSLELLLDRGPLGRLHSLRRAPELAIPWSLMPAACDVVRRQSLLRPTVTVELNPRALGAYYMVGSFQPDEANDYLLLDRVLGRLPAAALLEVCVEPARVCDQLRAHAQYLSRLQRVNRTWEDEEDAPTGNWPDGSREWALTGLRREEPLAKEIARRQQRFHETLLVPNLRFHIRVRAESSQTARLLASVAAESAFTDGSYQLIPSCADDPFLRHSSCEGLPRVIAPGALERLAGDLPIEAFEDLAPLANLAPVGELAGVFRLPLASNGSPSCCRKSTDPSHEDPRHLIVLGSDEQTGESEDPDDVGLSRGIQLSNLSKHVAIFGQPGGGKSIAATNVLVQLFGRRIPFVVFEGGKSEFRRLKCLRDHPDSQVQNFARELQLYTPASDVSPLRLNPLRVPEGIDLYEHIENLLACFKAAMAMEGSMPGLLGEGLERVYELHEEGSCPPTMRDLHREVRAVLDAKGYSGDLGSDFKAMFDTRLGVLVRRTIGRVFQCPDDAPSIGDLMSGHSVVELAGLPPDQACLLTLFMLTSIWEHVRATPWSGQGVRLVLLLEEAHNIVGRSTDNSASEANADPKAHASELICRMLAELRSVGVSIVILDQLPSSIAPQVVKLAGSKVAFREADSEEREILSGAMLFGPVEEAEIARLRPGEAFFHTEGYFEPRRIRTPNLQAEWDIPEPPVGKAILKYLRQDDWFHRAANVRAGMELKELMDQMERFGDILEQILAESAELTAAAGRDHQGTASARVRQLQARLARAGREFLYRSYRPLLGPEGESEALGEDLRTVRRDLVLQYTDHLAPTTQSCQRLLARLSEQGS